MSAHFQIRRGFGRLRWVLCGAAVVLDEAIADWRREVHRTGGVFQTDHLPKRDWILPPVATAELRSFVDRRPTKDLRAGASDLVAHAAAVAKPVGEDVLRVDAVVVL